MASTAPIAPAGVETVRIPLRDARGRVRAHAFVDLGDARALSRYRWHRHRAGYAARLARSDGPWLLMAREIMGLTQDDDGLAVVHRNLDRLDHRRANLVVVPSGRRGDNRSSVRGSSSRFRGVSWHRQSRKWKAYAQVDGTLHYLGLFVVEVDAAVAAADFRREHMPTSFRDHEAGAPA